MSSSSARKSGGTRPRKRPGVAAAAVFAVLLAAPAARAGTIKFCVDQANPMFQVDEAVANAAASAEADAAVFVIRDSSKADADDDSGNAQQTFFIKLAKTCDLIMGFPAEAGDPNLPDGMAASAAYARTGFVAAATGPVTENFAAMVAKGKVGVVFLTPALTYFTAQTMAAERVYDSNEALYGALLSGAVDDALIWQPWLVRQLAGHREAVQTAFLPMPHTAWNIEALHGPGGGAAAESFNAGLRALRREGKLQQLISPYQSP